MTDASHNQMPEMSEREAADGRRRRKQKIQAADISGLKYFDQLGGGFAGADLVFRFQPRSKSD